MSCFESIRTILIGPNLNDITKVILVHPKHFNNEKKNTPFKNNIYIAYHPPFLSSSRSTDGIVSFTPAGPPAVDRNRQECSSRR